MSEQNVVDASSYDSAGDYESGNFGNEDFGNSEFDGNNGGTPPPGMGQSKSSRRRRRKRKSKAEGGPGEGGSPASEATTIVMEGESLALAASSAPAPQQQARRAQPQPTSQNNGGGQNSQQQQGAGGKRWKKKFRDRDRRTGRSENPGNELRPAENNGGGGGGYRQDYRPDNFGNMNGGGGFKRKNKGGGGGGKDRGFVGPMDHSYREVSADFAAAPPSTIQVHASHGRRGGHRHHGDSQPIDHNMPRPKPIPENAQTHIYFFIEELFFIAKIQETAKKLGVKVAFIKNDKDALAELTDGDDTNKPALIVFDLNNANAKPLTLIPKLKTKLKRSASIVGFLSHLQGDLKAKAVEAGCDVVMPRSAFSQNLPNLLRRYGVEEEEEVNYNY
ncbi:MAG: response regulator [Acidobacteriota bacterium]